MDLACKVKIVEETKDYIVAYKPFGLAVSTRHPTRLDLEHVLRAKTGKGLYPITRIDQPIEGLVLFAASKESAACLSAQLKRRELEKKYLAVVCGSPGKEEGELSDYLVKDGRQNFALAVSKPDARAKRARLFYRLIAEKDGLSLLAISLYTGRHHQIRVQLSNANIPILGDRKYNPSSEGATYPALCSFRLSFFDPSNGERKTFGVRPAGEAFEKFSGEIADICK